MSGYYKLDEAHRVLPASREESNQLFDTDRRVKDDTVGNVRISTVFLVLDHNYGDGGAPLVFETMIFGGKHDQFQERYSTWKESEEGHERALKLVKEVE